MKYHRIKCELYKTEGKLWKEMVDELLVCANEKRKVVRLILFTVCTSNQEYLEQKSFLEQSVERLFVSPRPLVSLVAQKPLEGDLILEVHSLTESVDTNEEVNIQERATTSGRYLRIEAKDYVEVLAGGLYAEHPDIPVRQQSEQVFLKAEEILKAEEMTFGNITRQWNYLERITDFTHGNQCYQDFNDVRSCFYDSSEWLSGYPAATGIGTQQGGVQIDFNAIKGNLKITPVDNDWQRAAHVYSDEVLISQRENTDKKTPKFERGKAIADHQQEMIYISGTAAIRGEDSIAIGDVVAQTEITLENIQHLIGIEEGKEKLPEHSDKLELLRIYLKYEDDVHKVKEDLDKLCPNVPIAYLYADVCREELLVEIEGIACT